MSRYDELKNNYAELYQAAKDELAELDAKREDVVRTLNALGPLIGIQEESVSNSGQYSLDMLKSTSSTTMSNSKRGRGASHCEKRMPSGRHPRVKEEDLRKRVCEYLEEVAPRSMTPIEIFTQLIKDGLPDTQSLRARVYGKLGAWAKEGIIVKVDRGVYQAIDHDHSN